ncbi:DoxX family protein [Halobacillus sp. A1]|uniref:DoxX family protein n=1 Tax=Halobacillus sp. A1 TaxID=2880262 RepID=UPI0020A6BB89|nr:DoxX family protein [Halobacillus sp. A1]MCP3030626.1 DoxX family protein [Halobacillus sp. A1]
MIKQWFTEHVSAAIILLGLRIYLGYSWFTSGLGKITGGFDTSGYLQGAIGKAQGEDAIVQPWWGAFLETFALPNSGLFTFLVMWGELLVGLALLIGLLTKTGAFFGMLMNMAFLLSGTISSNPEMLIIGSLIILGGTNAGRIGLDRYVKSFIKQKNLISVKKKAA